MEILPQHVLDVLESSYLEVSSVVNHCSSSPHFPDFPLLPKCMIVFFLFA